MPEIKRIYTFELLTLCSLAFYVEIEVLKGVEIENLKSTVITINFDNHYDFIKIRKKGKVLHKRFFLAPLLQIRRTDFSEKISKNT